MKQFIAALFFFAALSLCSATTVDEVIQLAKLKTSDDLIIETIGQSKIDPPATAADVVRLKQEGISEAVIKAVMGSESSKKKTDDAYRVYEATGKDGKKLKMATNIDPSGKRMGGPPPPPMPVYDWPEPPAAPKEINITIKHEEPRTRTDESEDGYVDSQQGGIPFYSSFPAYASYGSPFFGNFHHHQRFCPPRPPVPQPRENFNPYRPRMNNGSRYVAPTPHTGSAGTRATR